MSELACPFRRNVRQFGATESATCDLVLRMIRSDDLSLAKVDRSGCEYCCDGGTPKLERLAVVFPSLLFAACDQVKTDGVAIRQLQLLATQAMDACQRPASRSQLASCDVICLVVNDDHETFQAIESVLNQQNCVVFLHLVTATPQASLLVDRYRKHSCVRIHTDVVRSALSHEWQSNLMQVVHKLLPKLRTPFVALQSTNTVSEPDRFARATGILEQQGAEFYAGSVKFGSLVWRSTMPQQDRFARTLLTETLVMRRASLADMGGIAVRDGDEDAELVYRALAEGRSIQVDERVTVRRISGNGQSQNLKLGNTPRFKADRRSLREHGIGFEVATPQCDVVLPFHNQFSFVEQAIQSLLQQRGIDPIIHLIDDASTEDASSFLARYADHERIRCYRNLINVGQFISVNNLFPFLETDLIAIQDGDDLSYPERLAHSAHLMAVSGADIFGAATELFGDPIVIEDLHQEALTREGVTIPIRFSRYPCQNSVGYFLENPTMMFRKSFFGYVAGYTDYGSTAKNRTGVDTEFMIRAYLSGAHVAVSRDIVLKFRCHQDSATQHPETRWQSIAGRQASQQTLDRRDLFLAHSFDPRLFGRLGQHDGITVPLSRLRPRNGGTG